MFSGKIARWSVVAALLIAFGSATNALAQAAASSSGCLVGKWTATEHKFTKSFTFREDKTGTEVESAKNIRDFTWEVTGDKVHIIYPAHGDYLKAEWNLSLDCGKNALSVMGLVYRK
jgi:hypothetical protein